MSLRLSRTATPQMKPDNKAARQVAKIMLRKLKHEASDKKGLLVVESWPATAS